MMPDQPRGAHPARRATSAEVKSFALHGKFAAAQTGRVARRLLKQGLPSQKRKERSCDNFPPNK
jgi:hypothetical protein